MPGVVVTTAVRTGPSTTNVAASSTYFLVGTAERGPTNAARLINSAAEFETWYGGYNASYTLQQQVKTYFEEGGARCYVARVVGGSVTSGTLTLQGTGSVNALRLDATNPGAWSADVSAEVVVNGSFFSVRIYFKGAAVYSTGDVSTASAAADKINSAAAVAPYVTATVLSGSLALLARVVTPLSTGTNGTAPTAANYVTGLDLFGYDLGAGAVAIPGQTGSTIFDGLRTHAVANNRIALCAFAAGASTTDATSGAALYATTTGAEYMGFYYPYVNVPGDGGVTLTISPESYVAAKRAVAHNSIGPWQAGAGVISTAKWVTGLAAAINKTAGDTLDAGRVNAIRIIQGSVRVYGARSASSNEDNWRYITLRDTINNIVVESERRLEDLVLTTIDGRRSIFGKAEARLVALLEPMRKAGGLYEAYDANGNMIDPGYSVKVTDANNPVAQLASGLVKVNVGVRVSSVGDQIQVTVTKSNLTNSVV